jgi:hypothetical protein
MYSTRKYPRTLHLPQSLSATSDDKIHSSIEQFSGMDVVVTEKMDGENTTIHCGGTHARSIDGRYHPSRSWMKKFAATISPQLDQLERICGEYLFARHSIEYNELPTYFLGFAWFIDGQLQSWGDTVQRFDQLGVASVPVLYHGPYYAGLIEDTAKKMNFGRQEGFVLRASKAIDECDFSKMVGKYVRKGHVQTDRHWMQSELVQNSLRKDE